MSGYVISDEDAYVIRELYETYSDVAIAEIIGKERQQVYNYRRKNKLRRKDRYPKKIIRSQVSKATNDAPVVESAAFQSFLSARWA